MAEEQWNVGRDVRAWETVLESHKQQWNGESSGGALKMAMEGQKQYQKVERGIGVWETVLECAEINVGD